VLGGGRAALSKPLERPMLRSIAERFQAMTLLEETPKIDPVVVPVKLNWDLKVRNQ
jgi:hypothetical protein